MVEERRVILDPKNCPDCAEREKNNNFSDPGEIKICNFCQNPYSDGKGNSSPRVDAIRIDCTIKDLVTNPKIKGKG